MEAKSNISRKVMLSAFGVPMLGVYMLTIWCGLGNFLADCCMHHLETEISQPTHGHHHSDDHHHGGHDHSKPEQQDKNGKDDCCSDVTTAFFSVFQQQAQPYSEDFQIQDGPSLAFIPEAHSGHRGFDAGFRQMWLPPPRPTPSGFSLRILHQSFLI